MLIKVLAADSIWKKAKSGKSYKAVEVQFESDGSNKSYSVFPNDPMADKLLELDVDGTYEVDVVKDGQYYKWAKIRKSDKASESSKQTSGVAEFVSVKGNSTYSTKEEREDTQRKIVRQFAINASISLLKTDKKQPTSEEVEAQAERFVAFVYEKKVSADLSRTDVKNPFKDMEDDVPV